MLGLRFKSYNNSFKPKQNINNNDGELIIEITSLDQ